MTLSLFTSTTQTGLINSSIKLNSSVYRLHQRHIRLFSTSKQTDPGDQSPDEQTPEVNAPGKVPSYLSVSELSNSAYVRPIKQKFRSIQTKLSEELGQLPTRLSQVTGYGDIDKLKSLVSEKEADLKASRAAAFEAKLRFNQAAQRRAESVREVNDLLARKASWSDQDLARFTSLVRTDHANEQAESEAKKLLEQSESQVDHQFTNMMQAILTRYHEEQVWSDKIRALSTTFSLSITVINVLVFLAAIVLVEPYKRSKMVSEVEERITARDAKNSEILDRALNAVVDRLSTTEKELSELVLGLQPPPSHSIRPDEPDAKEQNETTWVVEEPGEEEMQAELENQEARDEETSPEWKQTPSSQADSPLPGCRETLPNMMSHERDRQLDQDLLKAIGLGTMVGIILMTGFQLFSR